MRRRFALALLLVTALATFAAGAANASTWCGAPATADLLPQTVAGPTVHFIYAYPSDGADRLADFGTIMQTDAETIDAWWRAQDPTRTPRFDLFSFACGPQLDITDLRLPGTGAELRSFPNRFDKIITAVAAARLVNDHEIDVVYYDGPDDDSGVCGEGGTTDPTNGGSFAVVFTGGCTGEPTAVTAAHELTHALGAVFAPAPHDCPPPNDGHVCDSNRDLMYPFVDGTPLANLLLDVGRDDYYGAAGVGFDVRTSAWLRHLDEATAHLALTLSGMGTVASDVPGAGCTVSCTSDWDGGQTVTLSATPAPGLRFVHWGGACSGETSDCTLTLAGTTSVSALFAPLTYLLRVGITGHGNVFTSASNSLCQKRCAVPVPSYRSVVLHAVAQAGWRFTHWGAGSCRGTRPSCTLPMTSSEGATAVFAKKPKAKAKHP